MNKESESESEKCRSIHVSQQMSRNSFGNEFYLFVIAHLPLYHWWELPQVSFLSRQKYACRDKTFAATKICSSRQNIFVATKLLSRQIFVATKLCLSRQMFVIFFAAAKVCLSRQNVCHDKHVFVATNIDREKRFVATKDYFVVTNTCLSRQTKE